MKARVDEEFKRNPNSTCNVGRISIDAVYVAVDLNIDNSTEVINGFALNGAPIEIACEEPIGDDVVPDANVAGNGHADLHALVEAVEAVQDDELWEDHHALLSDQIVEFSKPVDRAIQPSIFFVICGCINTLSSSYRKLR